MPVITMLDEHNVAAFNKVYDMMSDKDHVAYLENYYRWDDWTNGEKFYNQFYEGRALFYANLIGSLNKQSMPEFVGSLWRSAAAEIRRVAERLRLHHRPLRLHLHRAAQDRRGQSR